MIAISILTFAVFTITILFQRNVLSSIYWMLFIQGAIFFNAIQHIVLCLIFFSYNPGTFSSILIVLFSINLFFLVLQTGEVPKNKFIITLLLSLISYPIFIFAALLLARLFT